MAILTDGDCNTAALDAADALQCYPISGIEDRWMLSSATSARHEAGCREVVHGPQASANPSSIQPVMPPAMIFTGYPRRANRNAPRAAPLQ